MKAVAATVRFWLWTWANRAGLREEYDSAVSGAAHLDMATTTRATPARRIRVVQDQELVVRLLDDRCSDNDGPRLRRQLEGLDL